jgi:ketosteroid isomerase-like protein
VASVSLREVARPEYYGNPAGLTEDIDVVRAIYAAFAVRDLEGALDFVDPACELHVEPTARAAGRRGPYVGHDGLRQYFKDVEAVWNQLEIHAGDFRVVPGAVVVMGHVEGQGEDGAFRRSAIWTWRLSGGRAVQVRVTDTGPAHPARDGG